MEDQNQINDLLKKIDQLDQQQNQLQKELVKLRVSVLDLQRTDTKSEPKLQPLVEAPELVGETRSFVAEPNVVRKIDSLQPSKKVNLPPFDLSKSKEKTPLEEFIGTNLLNKIGIVILVLGISYGVKYSIDHNLINPITRIILGYLAGIAMVLVAIKLKKNYKTFSAVILSGGMASMYFITYAAYDFYALMPQAVAFAMMVLFTAFTVFASLQYDQKVIALFGLVGAYGVPFLLSDGSGRVVILFSYISIVNFGILALAFKKSWKDLYYAAFSLTWIIFAAWYFDQFNVDTHLWTSLIFSGIFFITFYIVFLAYKLIQGEPFSFMDIGVILLNSFVFFGFGYSAIGDHSQGELFLGLFTLFNAVLHFLACLLVFRNRQATPETFYLVGGMVLVFLTLAVPVQLNGHWVTVIWAGESALLFWIGRTKTFPVFERLSYVLVLLSVGSLLDDWKNYDLYTLGQPEHFVRMFFNVQFLSSVIVIASLGWTVKLNFIKEFQVPSRDEFTVVDWVLGTLFLTVLYFSIFKEIDTFWQQRYIDSQVTVPAENGNDQFPVWDHDLLSFKSIFLLIYSAVFGIALSLFNQRIVKNDKLAMVSTVFNVFILFLFVVKGLLALADLRTSYILQTDGRFYIRDFKNIAIRYVSYLTIIPLVLINRRHFVSDLFKANIKVAEIVLLHVFILAVVSSELVNWLELARVQESLKLGLSILWGAYALMLIVIGLKQNSKPLRVLAIILFSVTIAKLFLYDMADMSTIAKTIVMIILGVLMLVASFLYNKVKKSTETI